MSRDYINSLPIIKFEGDVVVVNQKEQAIEVIKDLENEQYVGFDTESRPSFKKGILYPISILQFATHDIVYLFQLKKSKFSDELANFFSNSDVKKIGIGIKNDIEKLQNIKPFDAEGFIDLSKIAAEKGIIQIGARGLTARYIKHRLVKTAQKTNWAKPELSHKQKIYAASDAWICLKIYPYLIEDPLDYSEFPDEDDEMNLNNHY
jgi:ribonuclease D